MAVNIIKIKRTTGATAPSSLNAGELAFSGGTGTQGNMVKGYLLVTQQIQTQ